MSEIKINNNGTGNHQLSDRLIKRTKLKTKQAETKNNSKKVEKEEKIDRIQVIPKQLKNPWVASIITFLTTWNLVPFTGLDQAVTFEGLAKKLQNNETIEENLAAPQNKNYLADIKNQNEIKELFSEIIKSNINNFNEFNDHFKSNSFVSRELTKSLKQYQKYEVDSSNTNSLISSAIHKVQEEKNIKLGTLFNQYFKKSLEAQQLAYQEFTSNHKNNKHSEFKQATKSANLAKQEIMKILDSQSLRNSNRTSKVNKESSIMQVNNTKELFAYLQDRNNTLQANLWTLNSFTQKFKEAEFYNVRAESSIFGAHRKRSGDTLIAHQRKITTFIHSYMVTANDELANIIELTSKQSLKNELGENLKTIIDERDQLVKSHIDYMLRKPTGEDQRIKINSKNREIKALVKEIFKQAQSKQGI